ncbi:BREX system serine/threonine kinase PglW [Pseudonocardia asaccharolytica]|uniref:non-specific serine/threonine protein kinase n=1 Tax=Pseudonocardia asaccharolytica DSM 44247 = NBRC 16224 TaxID=1123024 RepID=A0A511CXL0_9PSEU|nr:BREX system serine/threonine kinase PglW [Pseudonocardia asaccharolytica]GEL17300.1 protein kinase [Pseudonocardia asaccharolytica DSM 44247 = NBRC 16224]
MEANSSRWHEITPSSFAHEQAALRYVRDLLPDRHPYQAWSNFTFISDHGHIREVDLLVAAPTGLFLIEIKNYRGGLTNSGSTWILTGDRSRSFDNPLPLADQKAKELKSLLGRAAAKDRSIRMPFVRGCVFLAEPQMTCALDPEQRHHVYVPDESRAAGTLGRIGAGLLLAPVTHAPPPPEFLSALPRLLQKVGIHRTRRSVAVGPWQVEPRPYDSGPTWQDHHASREDLPGAYRRIRIYLHERQADPEARTSVRHAAQREFLAAQGIEHPGLLVPRELLDHEMGPALVIDQHAEARRLDHYMTGEGKALDLPARLGLVRQLAEAVGYAHDRRLVHRALSPRAIIVEPGEQGWSAPRLRIGEWQSAARGLSSTSTTHRVEPTTHAGRHVEAAAGPYLAPEFTGEVDGTVGIDVFGLGATAYLLLTGGPPAEGRSELMERLAAEGGLHPSVVFDAIPPDVDALVALTTAPRVSDRPDVEEFLVELDRAIGNAQPQDQPVDPWDAQVDAELPDGYRVRRVLGTGATARAFLVERDSLESVLKVGRSAQAEERLGDEAIVLEGLRHEHLVLLRRGVFELGSRHAIEIDYAGDQTLAQLLRAEGAPVPDQLQRFGDQLLDVVDYLGRRETFHRDIKPDNLGVRRHPKRGPALVLFDFSLAGASASDVLAGTRGYRDPFLGTDRRPTYDGAAELYAVAVTLHEMASLELPLWSEDGTDPRFADEVTISSELFEAGLREPLTAFFRRALDRDADERYPTAGAMRQAWNRVFTAMDEQAPARTSHSSTEDPKEMREEAASAATADTALDAAGLSLRAVAVAQRLGASTVGELMQISTRDLWRARGLARSTRLELVNRTTWWRRNLLTAAPGPVRAPVPDTGDGLPPTLDAIVAGLLPAPTKRGADQRELTRLLLGLPGDDGTLPAVRWPTLADVAAPSGLTRARISQIVGKRRIEWAAVAAVDGVREDLAAQLRALGRVAAASELVDQLLITRGCDREEDPQRRRAYGYAVLRAACETDSIAESPMFATRRHRDRVLVALQVGDEESLETPSDAQLLDMAVELSDEAVRLASLDPLPTPVAVVRALETVARRHDQVPAERRLVQLAAAASGTVLANARLELYPRDLDPIRALRLSQAGAGVPDNGLKPDALVRRVAARFPGLAALPEGLEFVRLLREAGFDLRWDGDLLVPPRTVASSSSWRSETSTGGAAVAAAPAGESGPEARLRYVLEHGGVRMVTVRRSRWAACRRHVAGLVGAEVVDASAAFVSALREIARERRIADFGVVLRADAPDADPRARANLQRVVDEAWVRLRDGWDAADVLVLDALTPFGRYPGGVAVLDRLLDAARRAGRDGGPRTVVLLCPAQDEQQAPRIGAQAVGLTTAEEWIVAPARWTAAATVA